jgi:O-antigen/teichoic acid export membrane protein
MNQFVGATKILFGLGQGHERSNRAKRNIAFSFIFKGLSILISIILVRITINYINPSRYGIWLTLSSIIGWLSFFDIGLTQGLRNKFADAKAKGNNELAQEYVSTTYAILFLIFATVWIVFFLTSSYINWADILNVSQSMNSEIGILAIIIFSYFCLQFILKTITTIITADQQPAKAALIDVAGQFITVVIVFILTKTTQGSLIVLGIVLCGAPLVVIVFASLYYFNGSYKIYKPKYSKINFIHMKGLFNLGLTFFVIQIAGVIQFQSANIIIAKNYDIASVTSYNIVYKYFSVLTMFFAIFTTPFWSASTEAYVNNDIEWIKNAVAKYKRLYFVLIFVGIIMLYFSEEVYQLWIGKGIINISFALSFWACMFFLICMFGSIYVAFLNGISALKIQFLANLASPFLYIGVAILLIKVLHLGIYSVFIASIISNFNGYILAPLQYHKIINKNKKGIWIK